MNCKMWWYLGIAPKPLSLAHKTHKTLNFRFIHILTKWFIGFWKSASSLFTQQNVQDFKVYVHCYFIVGLIQIPLEFQCFIQWVVKNTHAWDCVRNFHPQICICLLYERKKHSNCIENHHKTVMIWRFGKTRVVSGRKHSSTKDMGSSSDRKTSK